MRRHGLSNPIYVGEVVHKGKRYRVLHEAIIGRDTWDPVRRRWFAEIRDGTARSVTELAASHDVARTDIGRGIPLTFLAPDIVEAIVSGHQPGGHTAGRLKRVCDLLVSWTEQRMLLGFAR